MNKRAARLRPLRLTVTAAPFGLALLSSRSSSPPALTVSTAGWRGIAIWFAVLFTFVSGMVTALTMMKEAE